MDNYFTKITWQQILEALLILELDQSTAVAQPLRANGNPVWLLPYHDIARTEREIFPHLITASGSVKVKQPHVKNAVKHRLARELITL